jgi:hypothetical protein
MAEVRRHHSFEHTPEHVRRHTAGRHIFGYREMESLEQLIERITPEIISDVSLEPALQRVRLEQPSIQEGNGAKGGCSSTSTG